MRGFRRIAERTVHQGHIWHVVVADFESPEGEPFQRDLVRSPGAVSVVPVMFDPEGTASVVLVRQYRATLETEMIEIPAGMRDVVGEEPIETARRELIEETGYRAGELELLTMYHPSAGMTDATHHVFLATGLEFVGNDVHGPEEEHMTVLHLPLADAVALIASGAITASNTIIGLLLAERRLSGR